MLIKQVSAAGFGVLQGRSFTFEPGLNIVYGPNEAGKSTLQFLIYALLYGLKKEKTATLREEAERYRPWQRPEPFGGSMEFSVSGRDYLVQRDFTAGSVRLFDALTGADAAERFGLDPKNQELLFAQELLGLSPLAFRNLTYVGQLANRCEREFAQELAGRLANLSTAGEEEISLPKALAALKCAKQELGTLQPSGKPLGRLVRRAAEIRKAQKEQQARLSQLWQEQKEQAALTEELRALEKKYQAALSRRQTVQARLLAQLQKEIAAVEERLSETAGADFPSQLSGEGSALSERQRLFAEELKQKQAALEKLQLQQAALEADIVGQQAVRREVSDALGREPLQAQQALLARREELKRLRVELELQRAETKPQTGKIPFFSLAAAGLSLAAALLFAQPLFFLPFGVSLLASLLLLGRRRRRALQSRRQQAALSARKEELTARERTLEKEEARLAEALGSAGLAGWQEAGEQLAQKQGKLNSQAQQLTSLAGALGELAGQLEDVNARIRKLFVQAKASSWDEFWQQCALRQDRERLRQERVRLEGKRELLLAGESAEALEARLPQSKEEPGQCSQEELARISGLLADIELERAEKRNLLSNIQGRLAGAQLEAPAVLAVSLEEVQEQIAALTLRREALEHAENVLSQCAERLHRKFSPQLNGLVSRIFTELTDGSYQKVLADDDLKLAVLTPAGSLVEAEVLSAGTLDQLYFALRLALSQLVSEKVRLPFLLDDTLVQADGRRAGLGWKCLRKLAATNQIIYFTCHKAEPAGENVNIIDLTAERRQAACS